LFTRTSPKPLLRKGGDRISPLSKGRAKRGSGKDSQEDDVEERDARRNYFLAGLL